MIKYTLLYIPVSYDIKRTKFQKNLYVNHNQGRDHWSAAMATVSKIPEGINTFFFFLLQLLSQKAGGSIPSERR